MEINDNTFFDYLDGLLSPDEIRDFEDYLNSNPEAQKKLNNMKESEIQLKNSIIDDDIVQDIPQELLSKANDLGKKLDKSVNKSSFLSSFIKPLIDIPIQAKGMVAAMGVCVYFAGYSLTPVQMASIDGNVQNNEIQTASIKAKDIFTKFNNELSNKSFLPESKFGDVQSVKIDKKVWNIEDITQTLKTRGSAQALELSCKDQDETKIIEISPETNPLDKNTLTYCKAKGQQNWELLNIKIRNNQESISLNSNYKIIFEKDSLYLIPQK